MIKEGILSVSEKSNISKFHARSLLTWEKFDGTKRALCQMTKENAPLIRILLACYAYPIDIGDFIDEEGYMYRQESILKSKTMERK